MSSETPQESENGSQSVHEENEKLRNQLAVTQEQLRLLQAKNDDKQVQNGKPTKRRNKNRWNWMQRDEHELVPQEDSPSLVEIPQHESSSDTVVNSSMDSGLHRRHLEHPASPTLEHDEKDTPLSTPFAIKAKTSDLELRNMEKGKHSPNRSDASDESFLNEYPIEEECSNIEDESFLRGMVDRSGWLVGLLILQSCSSFILSSNQDLLQEHPVLVQFLTMLVGAGGNAGNQASVRVIRGLAVGSIRNDNIKRFLWSEFRMGICLSLILGVVGCIRAAIFMVPLAETMAITLSLLLIVVISVAIGATLPLVMHFVNIDPAHSSTTIQVLMDILGVSITCLVSGALLHSHLGKILSPDLYADSSDNAANSL